MAFTNDLPPIPDNAPYCIAFIVHRHYDASDIKVAQDLLLTVISRNPKACYLIFCENERVGFWIREYLKIFHVYKYKWIDVPHDENKNYFTTHDIHALTAYRSELGNTCVKLVYVLSDNPKSVEITELVKAADLLHYRIYNVNSEGDFVDYQNPNNSITRRAFIEGRFNTNVSIRQDQRTVLRQGFTEGGCNKGRV